MARWLSRMACRDLAAMSQPDTDSFHGGHIVAELRKHSGRKPSGFKLTEPAATS